MNCIKPNAAKVVKPAPTKSGVWAVLLYSLLFIYQIQLAPLAWCQTNNLTQSNEIDSETENDPEIEKEKLPEIEAKTYAVKVLDRSKSNKVYLLDDVSNQQPNPGRILLLKREDEKFMAFRVLKIYPEKKAIAAKRIRRYGRHRTLEVDESFVALEKVSDLNIAPTSQDQSDLEELEGNSKRLNVSPYDPDLDKGSSPLPENQEIKKEDDEGEIDAANLAPDMAIEETKVIDHNFHWLTAGIGFVKNNNPPSIGGSHYFSAGNVRYGVSLGRMLFLDQPHLQDSLAIEAGIYVYKTLNFAIQGDSYSLVGIVGNLRYNILFSESFGVFIYSGIMKNSVTSSTQSQSSSLDALNSILPTGGIGLLFQVGPSWYTRVDMGIESVGLNLVLHF